MEGDCAFINQDKECLPMHVQGVSSTSKDGSPVWTSRGGGSSVSRGVIGQTSGGGGGRHPYFTSMCAPKKGSKEQKKVVGFSK